MAQSWRGLDLSEDSDLGSVPSTHTLAHNHPTPLLRDPEPSCGLRGYDCGDARTCIRVGKTNL